MEPGDGQNTQTAAVRLSALEGGELAAGERIGSYVVEKHLGSGGCASVYAARHTFIGRRAAIKVLRPEFASSYVMVQRFIREAKVVNVIRHPNIVDIFEFGHLADGRPFFVMEMLEGRDMRAVLAERGRFSIEEVLAVLTPLSSALTAAHAAGIIHRDLKASNVFMVGEPPQQTVKLLDFGIAKLLRPEPGEVGLTSEHHRLGTAVAMSPEQILGQPVDARSDVYGMGVMLFLLLTGSYPFSSNDQLAIDKMHLTSPPPLPSSLAPVPAPVERVVLKALAKQPEQRFSSIEALSLAFEAAVAEAAGQASSAQVHGVGLSVECVAGAEEDELWERAPAAIEPLEAMLGAAGFTLVVCTATHLLGVRALSAEPAKAAAEKQAAATLARTLKRSAEDALAGSSVKVRVRGHIDGVVTNGADFTGGALLDVGTWPVGQGELQLSPALGDEG